MPVLPRPSARVLRRSGLFTAADEVRDEEDLGEQQGTALGHQLFDDTRIGAEQLTMADERTSAEIDSRFDKPAQDRDGGLERGDHSSRPLESA